MFREYEKKQHEIANTVMPMCIKHSGQNVRKIKGGGNWEYYVNRNGYIYYIAKPNSGCDSGVFGDIKYAEKLIRDGVWKQSELTKLGRKVLG